MKAPKRHPDSSGAVVSVNKGSFQIKGRCRKDCSPRTQAHEPVEFINEFRLWGGCWWSVYKGKACPLPPRRGLALIHVLLQKPHKEIGCNQLFGAGSTPPPERGHSQTGDSASTETESEEVEEVNQADHSSRVTSGCCSSNSEGRQEILDKRARSEILGRIGELAEEIERRQTKGEFEQAAFLDKEKERLEAEIRKVTFHRRTRSFQSRDDRTRKAVQKCISEAIDLVEASHPELGRYLRASVRTGWTCAFAPVEPAAWNTEQISNAT